MFFRLVYDTLFELDNTGQPIPSLATSLTSAQDPLTFGLTIQPGVLFQDGQVLSAADVVFSLNLYRDCGGYDFIDAAQSSAELSLTLKLSRTVSNLSYLLSSVYILPRHEWEGISTCRQVREISGLPLSGSGPFRLEGWVPGESLTFSANLDYWKGAPHISGMVWKEYSSPQAALEAFQSGSLAVLADLTPELYSTLKITDGVQVFQSLSSYPEISDILLNGVDPTNCPRLTQQDCGGHPALRDPAVRQALAYAVDSQTLIEQLRQGLAVEGLTLVPPGNPFFAQEGSVYPFDLERANLELDQAGYKDTDQDGRREMPSGSTELIFKLNYPVSCSVCAAEAALLIENWQKLGIGFEAGPLEEEPLIRLINPSFQQDIVLWHWQGEPDPDFMLSLATTGQIDTGLSESGYANPIYDQLYQQQKTASPTERLKIIQQMQQILLADAVYIIPFVHLDAYAVQDERFNGLPNGGIYQPQTLMNLDKIQSSPNP